MSRLAIGCLAFAEDSLAVALDLLASRGVTDKPAFAFDRVVFGSLVIPIRVRLEQSTAVRERAITRIKRVFHRLLRGLQKRQDCAGTVQMRPTVWKQRAFVLGLELACTALLYPSAGVVSP
jgi:hypothetical protein